MQIARTLGLDAPDSGVNLPEPRVLWPEAAVIAALLLVQLAPNPAQPLLVLALIFWAVAAPHGVLQALSLCVPIVMANPGLAHVGAETSSLKWILIFVCLGRAVLALRRRASTQFAWVPLFAGFVGVTAILMFLVSYDVILSSFKLLSFVAGAVLGLVAFEVDTRQPSYWLQWFFTLHCVVVFLSLPTFFFPAGYLWTSGRSFQGIFVDPQGFAVYLGVGLTYVIIYVLNARRLRVFPVFVAGVTAWFMIASHCRGAMLAVGTSVGLCALISMLFRRRDGRLLKSWTISRLYVFALLAIAAIAGGAAGTVKGLALKGYLGTSEDGLSQLLGSFEESRGTQVRSLSASIASHPLAGVGFGLSPAGVPQAVEHDSMLGLPISAPIEQGFLPFAVVVQIGFVGAVALGVFLLRLAEPIVKFAPLPLVAMFAAALLVNIGEMIFFSPGGLGLQMWLVFGLCHEFPIRAMQPATRAFRPFSLSHNRGARVCAGPIL